MKSAVWINQPQPKLDMGDNGDHKGAEELLLPVIHWCLADFLHCEV